MLTKVIEKHKRPKGFIFCLYLQKICCCLRSKTITLKKGFFIRLPEFEEPSGIESVYDTSPTHYSSSKKSLKDILSHFTGKVF